jgi:hypothetical protein
MNTYKSWQPTDCFYQESEDLDPSVNKYAKCCTVETHELYGVVDFESIERYEEYLELRKEKEAGWKESDKTTMPVVMVDFIMVFLFLVIGVVVSLILKAKSLLIISGRLQNLQKMEIESKRNKVAPQSTYQNFMNKQNDVDTEQADFKPNAHNLLAEGS